MSYDYATVLTSHIAGLARPSVCSVRTQQFKKRKKPQNFQGRLDLAQLRGD